MCDELKGSVGQVAPTHAALDGALGKAGVGKERAAQPCVLNGLERGVRARHGVGVNDLVVLVRKNFAVIVGKRLVDEGIGEADPASALDLYSIYKTQGTLENLNIYLVGDLRANQLLMDKGTC